MFQSGKGKLISASFKELSNLSSNSPSVLETLKNMAKAAKPTSIKVTTPIKA
jgi:hypothetical protein